MGNCHKELENRLNEKGETRSYKVEWKRTNWGGEFEIEGGGGEGGEKEEEVEKGRGGDERTRKQFAYIPIYFMNTMFSFKMYSVFAQVDIFISNTKLSVETFDTNFLSITTLFNISDGILQPEGSE